MVDHSDKVSNVLLHSEGTFQVHAPTVAAQVGYDNCVATGQSINNRAENLTRSHEAVDEEQRLTPRPSFRRGSDLQRSFVRPSCSLPNYFAGRVAYERAK